MSDDDPKVMVFQVGLSGPVWIGHSTRSTRRVEAEMQKRVPWPLRLRLDRRGTPRNRDYLHAQLLRFRLRDDWFKPRRQVLSLIWRVASEDWAWPIDTWASRARTEDVLRAERAFEIVRSAALPIAAGERVGRQIDRATLRLGLPAWRIKDSWYRAAGGFSEEFMETLEAAAAASGVEIVAETNHVP